MNYTNDISENYIASGILNSPEKVIPQLRGEGITSEYFHLYLPKLIWRTANQFLDEGRIHEIGKLEFTHEIKGTVKGRELTSDISYIRSEWCGFEIITDILGSLSNIRTRWSDLFSKLGKQLNKDEIKNKDEHDAFNQKETKGS